MAKSNRPLAQSTDRRSVAWGLSAPRLSVVAPCFNEEACLPEFHARVTAAVRAAVDADYEILLVNDGSSDRTLDVMRALADKDPRLVVANLSRNHGHQLALTAGLTLCRGQRILIIDADLQDPPELLGRMMAEMDRGADVVFGQRRRREGETLFKNVTAALFYRVLTRLVDIDIPVDTGDFRLMSRRALDILNSMPERFRFIRGLVSWLGLRQVPIVYDRDPRYAGVTGYPLAKMVRFALDAITSFSIVPLRLASVCGCITAVCGLLMVGYTTGSWLLGVTVPGWTSLTTIVLILGSVQLLVLGIMGEYLGRLYLESKHRPLFIVESVYSSTEEPGA